MVYMPAEMWGKHWKLARPFHGPYVTPTNAEVQLVDDPTGNAIFVSFDEFPTATLSKAMRLGPAGRRNVQGRVPRKGWA